MFRVKFEYWDDWTGDVTLRCITYSEEYSSIEGAEWCEGYVTQVHTEACAWINSTIQKSGLGDESGWINAEHLRTAKV